MLGILIITGPTLLWLLEDDLVSLTQSYYGLLIIAKIAIASGMVALGGYNQFRIQRSAESRLKTNDICVHKKLKRSLKIEAMLGIVLLGTVALLANSSLPAQTQEAVAQKADELHTTVFSENIRFGVNIEPFSSGLNKVSVFVLDMNGKTLDDLSDIKMKISNPQKNIAPIEVILNRVESQDLKYEGEVTFGFSGRWSVEIEAQRTQHQNEAVSFFVFVKPRISEIRTDIMEYSLPDSAAPLYPAYDGDNTIWLSDTSKARLWKFTISEKQFTPYEFEGKTTVFLKIDDGKIWFTDTPDGKIGYFDSNTEKFTLIPLPIKSIPISLETDLSGNIWIALVDQHMLLKYDSDTNQFEEHKIPTSPSGPVALTRDVDGNIWFAESQGGKIGVINPQTGDIKEIMPEKPLGEPFALFIDDNGDIWISEHIGLKISKFNPVLETFEGVSVTDPSSLPFGLASDKFDNIWIAQHTADKLGVYDPHKNEFTEVDIPTKSTFTQFVTADKDGNIWFVQQRTNKLGSITISENPQVNIAQERPEFELRYTEFVAPFIAAGIIATSLFFVKSIHDRRRLDLLIE
jgi:copper transport protein